MVNRGSLVIATSVLILLSGVCGQTAEQSAEANVKVGDDTFKCITEMTPVRHCGR